MFNQDHDLDELTEDPEDDDLEDYDDEIT